MKQITVSRKALEEILDALKDTAAHYEGKWKNVGNHPASKHKWDMEYFQGLVQKLEKEMQ